MDLYSLITQIVAGGVIGFVIGMTGIGGGVLVMPTLTLLMGLPPSIAVGTASLYSLLTKVYAVYEHHKIRNIDYSLSKTFLFGAVPANLIVALLITRYMRINSENTERIAEVQRYLGVLIGLVLAVAAVMIIVQIARPRAAARENSSAPEDQIKGKTTKAVLYGFLVGVLIAATSVGGGVVIVPILISVFRLSTSKTVGTSIFIAVVLVLVSSLVYGASGQLAWETAIVMALGSIGGVWAGTRATNMVPEKVLKVILTILILFSAITMVIPN